MVAIIALGERLGCRFRGMRIRIKRKRHLEQHRDQKLSQGLLVFFGFGLEITISSNMSPTSCLQEQGVRETFLATTGFVAGCGSGACRRALSPPDVPGDDGAEQQYQKLEYVPTTIPTTRAKGESTKHLAAHQEQDKHGKESQTAGQDRSRKSLIDGLVDHVSERFLAQQTIVLSNAIEDDDRVVHGVTDEREKRRDNRERNLEAQQREKPQGDQHIMKNS